MLVHWTRDNIIYYTLIRYYKLFGTVNTCRMTIMRIAFSLGVRGRRSCAVLSNRDHRLKALYQNKTKKSGD